jgi:hypothetical protein
VKKIPTVFKRDPEDMSRVLEEWHPDCLWVRDGEGAATRKYDGTCVAYLDLGQDEGWSSSGPQWWVRREVKPGKEVPYGFHEVDRDEATGKVVGWFPAQRDGRWRQFQEALEPMLGFGALIGQAPREGTYELVGPKINGNPERAEHHRLEPHWNAERIDWAGPRTFESLREMVLWLAEDGVEGVVWHHPDGRMAKLKGRDFRRG